MSGYYKKNCLVTTKKQAFVTKASVPVWSRPLTNDRLFGHNLYGNDTDASYDIQSLDLATTKLWNHSRPIKQWRKQLIPVEVSGKSNSSMPIHDRPGSNNIIQNECCKNITQDGKSNIIYHQIEKKVFSDDKYLSSLRGKERRNICETCNDDISINTDGIKDVKLQKYNFDTKSYLRSRNKSFASNQNGAMKPGITYSNHNGCCNYPIPYSNDNVNGTQIRVSFVYPSISNDLPSGECVNKPVDIVVKPNNQQFFQQGAVSSSSRIHRIKYNTVTQNANGFSTAWGAAASNAGKYRGDGNSPYFIKSKNNICRINDYKKHWNSIECKNAT